MNLKIFSNPKYASVEAYKQMTVCCVFVRKTLTARVDWHGIIEEKACTSSSINNL
jgi:hypothetical protein